MITRPQRKTGRPTRAEQRAATRAALLDATIDSLIEDGYVATSTRGVAERAGVSQGALQNYFPTKAALVNAAVTRWFEQQGLAAMQMEHTTSASERELIEHLVDRLWDIHNLPIISAIAEYVVMERRDPAVSARLATSYNQLKPLVHQIAAATCPEISAIPGFTGWLDMALASVHGIVVFNGIDGIEPALRDWTSIRTRLLHSLDALISEAGSSAAVARSGGQSR